MQRVPKFKLGPGSNPEPTLGPLITENAAIKTAKHVQDAVNHVARVLIGGQRALDLGKSLFQPTVAVDVHPDSLCTKEETFGPFLPILKFETEEEAIALANKSEAGLAGDFFTENPARAWRVAERCRGRHGETLLGQVMLKIATLMVATIRLELIPA